MKKSELIKLARPLLWDGVTVGDSNEPFANNRTAAVCFLLQEVADRGIETYRAEGKAEEAAALKTACRTICLHIKKDLNGYAFIPGKMAAEQGVEWRELDKVEVQNTRRAYMDKLAARYGAEGD